MNTYSVRTHAGETLEIEADNVAEAIRTLNRMRPGAAILGIAPASHQRAAEQQA